MKKLVTMSVISIMLVLPVFAQQATTVTPAQAPTPVRKGKVTTVKPAIAQQAPSPATGVTAVTPAQAAKVPSVQAPSVVPAQATTVTKADAAPVVATPSAQAAPTPAAQIAPTPTVPFASAAPAPVAATLSIQGTPEIAAQASTVTTPEPRVVSTRPAATLTGQQSNVSTTTPTAKEPEYNSEKGFKGKVFEIKYREPFGLMHAVASLGSGFKGAQIRHNDEFKTITVRDFPENIAAIEEAIKRLDTPQPRRPDLEFHIQVLIASNTTVQGEEYTSDLNDVVKQLQSTLKYKNYSLMITSTHRTKEGGQVMNNGVAESKLFNVSVPSGNQIFYEYNMTHISLDSSTSAGPTVQMGNFNFGLRIPLMIGGPNSPVQYQNVGFRSPVSLREGEKVVVGTTTMGDKGLIVVLTAKVNK
jgi:hypothetical protein